MSNIVYCVSCEHACSPSAASCPACGHPLTEPVRPIVSIRGKPAWIFAGAACSAILSVIVLWPRHSGTQSAAVPLPTLHTIPTAEPPPSASPFTIAEEIEYREIIRGMAMATNSVRPPTIEDVDWAVGVLRSVGITGRTAPQDAAQWIGAFLINEDGHRGSFTAEDVDRVAMGWRNVQDAKKIERETPIDPVFLRTQIIAAAAMMVDSAICPQLNPKKHDAHYCESYLRLLRVGYGLLSGDRRLKPITQAVAVRLTAPQRNAWARETFDLAAANRLTAVTDAALPSRTEFSLCFTTQALTGAYNVAVDPQLRSAIKTLWDERTLRLHLMEVEGRARANAKPGVLRQAEPQPLPTMPEWDW